MFFITSLTVLSLIGCQEQDSVELEVATVTKPKLFTSNANQGLKNQLKKKEISSLKLD